LFEKSCLRDGAAKSSLRSGFIFSLIIEDAEEPTYATASST